jgi:hypothetical protein
MKKCLGVRRPRPRFPRGLGNRQKRRVYWGVLVPPSLGLPGLFQIPQLGGGGLPLRFRGRGVLLLPVYRRGRLGLKAFHRWFARPTAISAWSRGCRFAGWSASSHAILFLLYKKKEMPTERARPKPGSEEFFREMYPGFPDENTYTLLALAAANADKGNKELKSILKKKCRNLPSQSSGEATSSLKPLTSCATSASTPK